MPRISIVQKTIHFLCKPSIQRPITLFISLLLAMSLASAALIIVWPTPGEQTVRSLISFPAIALSLERQETRSQISIDGPVPSWVSIRRAEKEDRGGEQA